jgi:hypothetical protein
MSDFGVRWLATALGWEVGGVRPILPTHPKAAASRRNPKGER